MRWGEIDMGRKERRERETDMELSKSASRGPRNKMKKRPAIQSDQLQCAFYSESQKHTYVCTHLHTHMHINTYITYIRTQILPSPAPAHTDTIRIR